MVVTPLPPMPQNSDDLSHAGGHEGHREHADNRAPERNLASIKLPPAPSRACEQAHRHKLRPHRAAAAVARSRRLAACFYDARLARSARARERRAQPCGRAAKWRDEITLFPLIEWHLTHMSQDQSLL
jgi:hypothetical protein